MKPLAGMLLLAALVSPGTARAADVPEGKWWKHPRVAAEINLTPTRCGKWTPSSRAPGRG